jgi:hypothetical protein
MSLQFRHIGWQFFGDVPIKVLPISIGVEERFINGRSVGIKNKLAHVWVFLEICKDVIHCLEMSESRIGLVLG